MSKRVANHSPLSTVKKAKLQVSQITINPLYFENLINLSPKQSQASLYFVLIPMLNLEDFAKELACFYRQSKVPIYGYRSFNKQPYPFIYPEHCCNNINKLTKMIEDTSTDSLSLIDAQGLTAAQISEVIRYASLPNAIASHSLVFLNTPDALLTDTGSYITSYIKKQLGLLKIPIRIIFSATYYHRLNTQHQINHQKHGNGNNNNSGTAAGGKHNEDHLFRNMRRLMSAAMVCIDKDIGQTNVLQRLLAAIAEKLKQEEKQDESDKNIYICLTHCSTAAITTTTTTLQPAIDALLYPDSRCSHVKAYNFFIGLLPQQQQQQQQQNVQSADRYNQTGPGGQLYHQQKTQQQPMSLSLPGMFR